MGYTNTIRGKNSRTMPPKEYHAHFLKIIEKNGVFYISDAALQDEKNACLSTGKKFVDYLTENKLVIEETKIGWKITKQKEYSGMKSIFG